MAEHDNIDPALAAVLQRIRGQQALRPEDADLLEHHLTSDSLVPGVRNRAAWNQHIRHHGNAGVYVHADLNDFGQVNKQHGEDAGDDAIKHFGTVPAARVFRKGGDEFVAWLLRPEDAQGFTSTVQQNLAAHAQIPLTASLGVGYGRLQAEDAMRSAKAAKTESPATHIVSRLTEVPPLGWKPAEENIKDLRRVHLSGGKEADVSSMPGVPEARVEHRHPVSAGLKKDEAALALVPPAQPQHPVLAGQPFVMMSGEEPRYPAKQTGHEALKQELLARGHRFEEIQGFYGKPEKSFVVHGMPLHEARELGKDFGQESVVHSDGKNPVLLYTNGEDADKYHPSKGINTFPAAPTDGTGWSRIVDPGTAKPIYMNVDFDWDKKLPIHKLEGGSHPNNYDWHDEDGVGSPPEAAPLHLVKAEGDQPVNAQAAGRGVPTFAPTVAQWGAVNPGQASNLRHYDFRPFGPQIEDMAKKHGYAFKYMGPGNIPDLKADNYNTRSLHIWDPKAGSGGDFGEERYTDTWRKAHELAHALTYADINAKYGEGRRIGKLGVHRTPQEAKRAVEWEWLAAHKQREIGEAMGHHIPDEDFHRELNTVMADAVHRAVHGTFTEPSDEGFTPHPHKVPLEHAFKVIDDHAARMGLGPHETLKTKAAAQIQPAVTA